MILPVAFAVLCICVRSADIKLLANGNHTWKDGDFSFNTKNKGDPARWYAFAKNFEYKDTCEPHMPRVILELAGNYRSFTANADTFIRFLDTIEPPVCWAVVVACWKEVEATTPAWWGGGAEMAQEYNQNTADHHLQALEQKYRNRLVWAVVDDQEENSKVELARGRQTVLWGAAHEIAHLSLPSEFLDPSVIVFKSRPDAVPTVMKLNLAKMIQAVKSQPYAMIMLNHGGVEPSGLDPSEVAWISTVASQNMMTVMMRTAFSINGEFLQQMQNWERGICCGDFARSAFGGFQWQINRVNGGGAGLGPAREEGWDPTSECACIISRCIKDPFTTCEEACNGGYDMTHETAAARYHIKMMPCDMCFALPPFPNCDVKMQWRQPAGTSPDMKHVEGEKMVIYWRGLNAAKSSSSASSISSVSSLSTSSVAQSFPESESQSRPSNFGGFGGRPKASSFVIRHSSPSAIFGYSFFLFLFIIFSLVVFPRICKSSRHKN